VIERNKWLFALLIIIVLATGGCRATSPGAGTAAGDVQVLAAATFLADIAQNVAGERLRVEALIPDGVDPHGFEPTPQDVRRVSESDVLIVNGAGFEAFLQSLLDNAGGERLVIEAAKGLTGRTAREGEAVMDAHAGEEDDEHAGEGSEGEADPHFWLDPLNVTTYVENIRAGLSQRDPDGSEIYAQNASAYIAQLRELDGWITQQVAQVPEARRLLVTNHESFGYFADRYGFSVVGTVIPSVSTAAAPSAQQLARLVDVVRSTGAPAIFLETGANPQLAEQLGRETGAKVVTGLLTHSITSTDGPASDYIGMMRYNVQSIVDALK
jgi:ABC-type Zn uptake system ZnuABC Zn-binding protein ZnuA